MSPSTIRTSLLLLGLSLVVSSCSTARRAAEAEAGVRVARGVSAGADAVEDAVTGDGQTAPSGGATGSAPGTASGGTASNGTVSNGTASNGTASNGTPASRPGAGSPPRVATSTNDFESGTRTILLNDYTNDNLGDFPRHFELIDGSFEVVEWEGGRYLRALSGGMFAIPLPETLPERFTIETEVNVQHGNGYVHILPGRWFRERRDYRGSAVSVRFDQAGVESIQDTGPSVMAFHDAAIVRDQMASLQVMADGDHMKVYLGGDRVANVPNSVFPRIDTLFIALDSSYDDYPIFIGPIRIAAGGLDLYGALERDGRVALEGIYFDTDSDQLRPESHATLAQVGAMLGQYPDLTLSIEGHTDSQGDDSYNLDLSDRRAASVRRYLITEFGVEAVRLSSRGLGETQPVASNDSPEGRQENRRVELVRMP